MESQPLSLGSPGTEKSRKSEILFVVIMFLVGISLYFRVDQIPGELGDNRFNMYVLEHGYRWLVRLDKTFWSAPFFYPAQNVITYSDNHLGSFLFYSVFRLLGASTETAFQLWAITIFFFNYFVTWFVLRKQQCHPLAAAAAAYIFTFGLSMAAQIGHIQLAPRFMVPVAFWMALRFLDTGSPRYLQLLLAACAYQIYLGIYTGYFLILSLIPFCAALFLIRGQWTAVSSFIERSGRSPVLRRGVAYALSCIAFVLVLLPIAIPYYQTQQLLGHRTWEEVVTMLPRWQSYFYGPDSILWGTISAGMGANLPMANEHKLFPGILPYLAIIVFLYCCWRKKFNRAQLHTSWAMVSVLVVLVAVTSYLFRNAIYYYVWALLPGAGGIRAVSRITLVLLYPLVFILAVVGTMLLDSRALVGPRRGLGFLGVGLLGLTVIDQAAVGLSMSKRECKRRVARMEAVMLRARGNRVDSNVFWVNQKNGDAMFIENLDIMLAGQALGVNVVNGYSGLAPKGYPPGMDELEGDCCDELRLWAGLHPGKITSKSLVQVG
ncbi:MAG TPA: hypothetical protein VE860_00525, partial [Chthoniobacterales bacterium]|nr:hypothetical protein [Chthoniobacterales bacterium]